VHWTKRSIFLVTLVAFLSNLAFGMSVFKVQEPTRSLGSTGPKFQQKSSADLTFSAFEALEELEEFEQETDLDSDADSKVVYSQNYHSFTTGLHVQKGPPKSAVFEQDAFRTWLWLKQSIFIHFQVFRI
jgi:hypothetical protein